jgi:predicted enzyme related to lactoylglutathione lyase
MQTRLERVGGAGGQIVFPRTAIGMDAGYSAVIADTEGNTVGLHSQG